MQKDLPNDASTPEMQKLLDKYKKLKEEQEALKDSDPLKSEQKKWDAYKVAQEIEEKNQ